jgi:LGFP repeat
MLFGERHTENLDSKIGVMSMPNGHEHTHVLRRAPVILHRPPVILPLPASIDRLSQIGNIKKHWNALGGAPGRPISDLENVAGGYRIRYEHGAIYYRGRGKPAWVYGDIGAKYDSLGGPNSGLASDGR